jgi:hypothetical protein
MLMLMFRVAPAITHPRYKELRKSAANLFVNCTGAEQAQNTARAFLSQHHWEVEAMVGTTAIKERPDFVTNRQLAQLYDQARNTGVACLVDGRALL